MSEECPVCFHTLSSSKQLRLECGHCLCLPCGRNWLPQHHSCPLCRSLSERFSYRTRSFTKACELNERILDYHRFIDMWYHDVGGFVHFFAHHMLAYVSYLDHFFCKNRDLWYRPDMKIRLVQLQEKVREHLPVIEEKCLQEENIVSEQRGRPGPVLRRPFRQILQEFLSI